MRRILPTLLLAPGLLLACLFLFAAARAAPAAPLGITLDGNLTEPEWNVLATSAGGPASSFGVGHEINALSIDNDETSLYLGVAGDVQPGYRIVVFIDARAGGYTNAGFGRASAPPGVAGLNAGLRFDPTLSADYALVISSNAGHTDFMWDLYTLSAAGGPNVYLGDTSSPNLGAAPASGSTTQGFEARLSFAAVDTSPATDIVINQSTVKLFAMVVRDDGYLGNQFISHADAMEGAYGSGPVDFEWLAPDPVDYFPVAPASGASAKT